MKKLMITFVSLVAVMTLMLTSCGSSTNTEGVGPTEEGKETLGMETAAGSSASASGSTQTDADAEAGYSNGGDFSLTGQKWEWVEWDSDGDGEKEQISFEYIDNGDEAESVILVKLEGEDSPEAYIDRARRIVWIFAKKDEEGPYLQVEYNYENHLTEEADMECIIRIQNKAIVIE